MKTGKATKIDDADLWKAKALENQLTLEKERAERTMIAFQEHLDSMWTKHGLRKGVDEIKPDGTIVRGPEETK
jgi:hypothetical protein